MLIDTVEIKIRGGSGGDGIVSWRREKFVPRGGPDGGDGGRGGDVYLISNNNLDTLAGFRYRKEFRAGDGGRGGNKKRHGASGANLELAVPVGTVVTDSDTGEILADFEIEGKKVLVATGGEGGRGNASFATATKRRPEQATRGEAGQSRNLRLELKHVADVAVIGEPNAGKSSLLKALTGLQTRIAPFAFSTKEPVLGSALIAGKRIVVVDLPGLLKDAHKGRGLGDRFLRHASRVKLLLHLVDATLSDIEDSEQTVVGEIAAYHGGLLRLPRQLVLNKIDLLSAEQISALRRRFPKAVLISAEKNIGIDQVRRVLAEHIG